VTWQDSQVPEVLDPTISARLKRDDAGLVAAVVQQHDTGEVLMVGWMDDEALRRTLTEGRVTFWSRSRSEYWRKGDTSGHAQYVKAVSLDCDGDALLVQVDQVGAACHTGTRTCFEAGGDLGAVVGERDRHDGTPQDTNQQATNQQDTNQQDTNQQYEEHR
jgi:phosphoribosyl-AMP cyclohydrolase